MGLFKKRDSKAVGMSPSPTQAPDTPSAEPPPPAPDEGKAAAIIEKHARGNLDRKRVESMKNAPPADANPLLKCLPCLAPK